MSTLLDHVNTVGQSTLGPLSDEERGSAHGPQMPVMATPAAVAAGVAVTAAAFGVGFAAEEAADG